MNNKVILITLLFFAQITTVFAQTKLNESFIPASPNAAIAQKFQDVPVNLANGIPDITIPLYTVKTKSLTVPISLKYHAGGIKTSDRASWVGLGWDLECGGRISRTIKSNPDEGASYNKRFLKWVINPSYNSSSSSGVLQPSLIRIIDENSTGFKLGKYHITGGYYYDGGMYSPEEIGGLKSAMQSQNQNPTLSTSFNLEKLGLVDREPDLFYINTPFVNGKFMLNQFQKFSMYPGGDNLDFNVNVVQKDTTVIRTLTFGTTTQTDTAVNHSVYFGKWRIADDKGKQFYFGTKESSRSRYNYSADFGAYTEWNLDKIVDVNTKDSITFENTIIDLGASNNNGRMSTSILGCYSGYTQGWIGDFSGSRLNGSSYRASVPKRIVTADRQILFYSSMECGGSHLDSIVVSGLDNKLEQKILFTYSHFKSSGRLMLESIKTVGTDNITSTSAYIFNYDDVSYPPITVTDQNGKSFDIGYDPNATDYWGYYNRRVIPDQRCDHAIEDFKPQWPYSRLESLTDITFPTGAKTTFVYEPNGFSAVADQLSSDVNPLDADVAGGLRIKKITNLDLINGGGSSKEYDYSQGGVGSGISSGFLAIPPERTILIARYGIYNKPVLFFTANNRYESISGGPIVQYASVAELEKINSLDNGRTEYDFFTDKTGDADTKFFTNVPSGVSSTNIGNYPAYIPKDEFINLVSGKVKEKRILNTAGSLISRESNVYEVKNFNERFTFVKFMSEVETKIVPDPPSYYYINYYQLYKRFPYLKSTLYEQKDATNNTISRYTLNYYDSPAHNEQTKSKSINSKGDTLTVKTVYAYDCADVVNNYSYAGLLKQRFCNYPVAVYKFSNTTLTAATINTFQNFALAGDTAIFPQNIYSYNKATASDLSSYAGVNSSTYPITNLFINTDFKKDVNFYYSPSGSLKRQNLESGVVNSYVWSDNELMLLGKAVNASDLDIAYTGFEPNTSGGWSFSPGIISSTSFLGMKGADLTNGTITKNNLTSGNGYIVSYWINGTSPLTIAGTVDQPVKTKTIGVWSNFEHNITGVSTVVLSGTASIDELRIFPKSAILNTYNYDNNKQIIAQSDDNNMPTRFRYDALGRLLNISDKDLNIKKIFEYSSRTNAVPTHLFYNPEIIDSAFKQCTGGGSGSKVYYRIPYGKYSSSISYCDVMTLVAQDLNQNKQSYANMNGVCSALFYNAELSRSFDKNNCTGTNAGIRVSYTIGAQRFSSAISQADADQKARDDINANGQSYVNAVGVCKSPLDLKKISLSTNSAIQGAKVKILISTGTNVYEYFPDGNLVTTFYIDASSGFSVKAFIESFPGDMEPYVVVNGQVNMTPTIGKSYIISDSNINIQLSGAVL